MNYLFVSKKLNFCSSCLNLASSIGWIILVSLFCYYHINVLKGGNSGYYSTLASKSFTQNPFENIKQRTPVSSVQATNMYASAYISKNGLSSFFSEPLSHNGKTTYWEIIQPIYILSILFFTLNLTFSATSLFCSFKARETNYLVCSLANLFIPIIGGILTLKIYQKHSMLWKKSVGANQRVSPAKYLILRAKQLLSTIFSDSPIAQTH